MRTKIAEKRRKMNEGGNRRKVAGRHREKGGGNQSWRRWVWREIEKKGGKYRDQKGRKKEDEYTQRKGKIGKLRFGSGGAMEKDGRETWR